MHTLVLTRKKGYCTAPAQWHTEKRNKMKRKKKKRINPKNASSNNFETPDEIYNEYKLFADWITAIEHGYISGEQTKAFKVLGSIENPITRTCILSISCFAHIIMSRYKIIKSENPNKSNFQVLKNFIEEILIDEIQGYTIWLPNYEYSAEYLFKGDIETIKNILIDLCIELWLNSDKKACQNIHAYSSRKFLSKDKAINDNSYISPKTIEDNLRNGENKRNSYRSVILETLKKQGFKQTRNLRKTNKERPYHFTNLAFIDMLADNRTGIFELLYSNKEVLVNLKYKDKNKGLENAIKDFNSLIEEISHIEENREYLSKCIILRHIEYETHLRLTATISEYLVRNHLDPKIIHSDSIQNFLSLFWCPFGKDYIRFEVFNSYDIHNYTQKIYTAFNNNYNIIDTTREYTIRTIIIKLVSHIKLAIDCCNSTKKVIPSWTDTDYAEAADFFRNEYIVTEKIPTPEG